MTIPLGRELGYYKGSFDFYCRSSSARRKDDICEVAMNSVARARRVAKTAATKKIAMFWKLLKHHLFLMRAFITVPASVKMTRRPLLVAALALVLLVNAVADDDAFAVNLLTLVPFTFE